MYSYGYICIQLNDYICIQLTYTATGIYNYLCVSIGNLILTISPTIYTIQLVPLGTVNITLQVRSYIANYMYKVIVCIVGLKLGKLVCS